MPGHLEEGGSVASPAKGSGFDLAKSFGGRPSIRAVKPPKRGVTTRISGQSHLKSHNIICNTDPVCESSLGCGGDRRPQQIATRTH